MPAYRRSFVDVTPSASRLTRSLRDIGYDFVSALADIVDNAISAQATRVDVLLDFDGAESRVIIADDGTGMSETTLNEALRFGSRRDYAADDLGRFGLGLKTASLSQCRRLTVASRRAPIQRRIVARELDLAEIEDTDRWIVLDATETDAYDIALPWLDQRPGTVVVWDDLDRVLQADRVSPGWQRRRFSSLARRSADYLGMVFHRFIEGDADGQKLTITVNGEKVRAWNPFAPGEPERIELPESVFEVESDGLLDEVRVRPFVLPSRNLFSSQEEFDRLSGPRKWNRQQGLYVYRADRLIQSGGWCGLRAADEHTKLARAALDFPPMLDELFQLNVAKMRVTLPSVLRQRLERPVQELCGRAQTMYRRDGVRMSDDRPARAFADGVRLDAPAAFYAAALEVGELAALKRVVARLRTRAPELAEALGFTD